MFKSLAWGGGACRCQGSPQLNRLEPPKAQGQRIVRPNEEILHEERKLLARRQSEPRTLAAVRRNSAGRSHQTRSCGLGNALKDQLFDSAGSWSTKPRLEEKLFPIQTQYWQSRNYIVVRCQ